MVNIITIPVFLVGAVSIVIGNFIYFKKVIPALEQSSQKVSYSGLPTVQFRQWKIYKNLCIEKGASLKYWRILVTTRVVALVALAVWVAVFLLQSTS